MALMCDSGMTVLVEKVPPFAGYEAGRSLASLSYLTLVTWACLISVVESRLCFPEVVICLDRIISLILSQHSVLFISFPIHL